MQVSRAASGPDAPATGRAHAKVILLGEHAVVYGVPALAVALPQLTVTARASRLPQAGHRPGDVTVESADRTEPMPDETSAALRNLVTRFREVAGVADRTPLRLVLDSSIPPGHGLGASAAYARAVVLALAELFDHAVGADLVFDLVQTAETAAHGKASGIDAVVTGASGLIRYVSGAVQELSCGFDGLFVVGDSGVAGRTKDAIEQVRERFEADPQIRTDFLDGIRRLTEAGIAALADGERSVFGEQMSANHRVLRATGLSTDLIDALVAAALAAGSPGAKISGGGLGGCMVALATDPAHAEAVAAALRATGAADTWPVGIGRFAGAGG